MAGLVPAFDAILDKFSKFFDVLDLSYFISGAVAVSALVWWIQQSNPAVSLFSGPGDWAVTVLGCYVAGLICFAAGRLLRLNMLDAACRYSLKRLLRRLRAAHGSGKERHESESGDEEQCEPRVNVILRAVSNHHLKDDEVVKRYLGAAGGRPASGTTLRHAWSLYTRLWAEARQRPDLKPSLDHLNRSWVISATYDGLVVSFMVWVLALYSVFVSGAFSRTFQVQDIIDPPGLFSRIKQHTDKPSAYLYSLLRRPPASAGIRELTSFVDDYKAGTSPSNEMTMCAVSLLNRAIRQPSLRSGDRFDRTNLPFLTRYVVGCRGLRRDAVSSNKLLLEAAFPTILRAHVQRRTLGELAMIALLLLISGCVKEASRHFHNQVEELFATYAWSRDNRSPAPPMPSTDVPAPEEQP